MKAEVLLMKSTTPKKESREFLQKLSTSFSHGDLAEFVRLITSDVTEEKERELRELFIKAIVDGRRSFVEKMLEKNFLKLSMIKDESDRTLLHRASFNCIDLLLQRDDIPIEAEDNEGNSTSSMSL